VFSPFYPSSRVIPKGSERRIVRRDPRGEAPGSPFSVSLSLPLLPTPLAPLFLSFAQINGGHKALIAGIVEGSRSPRKNYLAAREKYREPPPPPPPPPPVIQGLPLPAASRFLPLGIP